MNSELRACLDQMDQLLEDIRTDRLERERCQPVVTTDDPRGVDAEIPNVSSELQETLAAVEAQLAELVTAVERWAAKKVAKVPGG